jgi:hypothetical protein
VGSNENYIVSSFRVTGDPKSNLHIECYGLASSSHKGFSEEKKREKRSGIFDQFRLK